MGQRNEHLPAANLFVPHVVLHDRVATGEPVLVPEPIEDPLGRMTLLRRPLLVVGKYGVDHAQPRPQLGPLDRLLALVAWRHRVREHLPNRLSRQPKLPGHRTLTPTFNTNRSTNPPVNLHSEHPFGVHEPRR
jgi:hypothetical protein